MQNDEGRNRRVSLITFPETLIILDITKTESNNCFTLNEKNVQKQSCFCFFIDSRQHKARELDMNTLRNRTPRPYAYNMITCDLDIIIV